MIIISSFDENIGLGDSQGGGGGGGGALAFLKLVSFEIKKGFHLKLKKYRYGEAIPCTVRVT
jgi:hypothetical protein